LAGGDSGTVAFAARDRFYRAQPRALNDLLSQALLLTRFTGMRIGATVDLCADCLRHSAEDRTLHMPLVLSPLKGIRGKLHNELWVPVDHEVRTLVRPPAFPRDPAAGFGKRISPAAS
jgi:hypothetical protein